MVPRIVAVVPIKRLDDAKSRLASRLTPPERRRLVLDLLGRVLDALVRSDVVERCLVVSADPLVRERAVAAGALGVDEGCATSGQNAALERARVTARFWNPTALLVISGDLPLITAADIAALARLGVTPGTVVIAPDRREMGTNALLLHPPDLLPFRFGPGSLRTHRAAATARGVQLRLYRAYGTAVDLDLPEDLDLVAGAASLVSDASSSLSGRCPW